MKELRFQKKVTLLGLGETGLASALFLKRKGFNVFVSDLHTSEIIERRAARLSEEGIPFELGRHTLKKVGTSDWVLVSPGIFPTAPIYRSFAERRIPLVSEIEVASWFSQGRVTAVTGTSGKTTVATLLERIFQGQGRSSVLCGNIGNPWIGEVDRLRPETEVVLEISSFQLLHTYSFRPQVGVLLNLGLNHLDWHPTMEDYVATKLRLFQNQVPEDIAIIRREDQQKFFPRCPFSGRVVYADPLPGQNANERVGWEITKLRGLDPAKTREIISTFEGLEHRMERVAEIRGIEFINDSKCTTLEALAWALDKCPDGKVILLAGGHAKGADFSLLREKIHRKLKQAVVFGEAQDLLWTSWEGAARLARAHDLSEAFQEALKIAVAGDAILLSPACASFDQFSNYKERGRLFKALVAEAAPQVVS